MIQIKSVLIGDVLCPETKIPDNNIAVICDGENYTVYFEGDEVPESKQE